MIALNSDINRALKPDGEDMNQAVFSDFGLAHPESALDIMSRQLRVLPSYHTSVRIWSALVRVGEDEAY